MQFEPISVTLVIDVFLLLLIGVGPKIALVPFLQVTAGMDAKTTARVTRKMIVTAGSTALLLIVLGEFLTRLLHFSPAALAIAGGLILFVISATMILSRGDQAEADASLQSKDPMEVAATPLGVPYLLNPAGIVVLVPISAEAETIGLLAIVLGLLVVVIAIDVAVFRWANRVGEHIGAAACW